MLQQTTTGAVEKKFPEFVKRYKGFKSFLDSSEEELLGYWSGLGFYRRAKNLWKTINIINTEFKSKIPSDKAKLINFPGIGKYTAASIRTIGFDLQDEPIDTNIYQLFSGLYGSVLTYKEIEFILAHIWPKNHSRDFTEALMDLTTQIKTKKEIKFEEINLNKFLYGDQQKKFFIPNKKKMIKKLILIDFFIFRHKGQIAFLKKSNLNFYDGFEHLPNSKDEDSTKIFKKRSPSKKIKSIKYIISNNNLEIDIYECFLNSKSKKFKWKSLLTLKQIALPTLYKKILTFIS